MPAFGAAYTDTEVAALANFVIAQFGGNIWVGEGVDLHDLDAIEGPVYIGNYCRIAPDASVGPYSVLSTSVTLRERARVSRSVIDTSTDTVIATISSVDLFFSPNGVAVSPDGSKVCGTSC